MTSRPKTHTWITCSTPKPNADLRLFCFPYAGGGSVNYHHWGAALPANIEVYAVKLPGRENRLSEPPFARMAPLVRALSQGLAPYMDRPFAFFGHSLGGLVSFELVNELLRQQRPMPVHLIVSAMRAPHIPSSRPSIHDLPQPVFIEHLRDYQGTPEAILNHSDMMDIMLPALRADFAVAETHTYSETAPLTCPITVLCGLQDPLVSCEALRAWEIYTRNTFTMHTIPGAHFFINHARSEVLEKVAQTLIPHLPEALSAAGHSGLEETRP